MKRLKLIAEIDVGVPDEITVKEAEDALAQMCAPGHPGWDNISTDDADPEFTGFKVRSVIEG